MWLGGFQNKIGVHIFLDHTVSCHHFQMEHSATAPLSDVLEIFVREIKWTVNPDSPLSRRAPPTKQPKT